MLGTENHLLEYKVRLKTTLLNLENVEVQWRSMAPNRELAPCGKTHKHYNHEILCERFGLHNPHKIYGHSVNNGAENKKNNL